VWTDARTKNHVAFFEKKLREVGLKGKKGEAGVNELREMWTFNLSPKARGTDKDTNSTGIQLSTYFSGIKLKWMIDHDPVVHKAHETDDLLFGTVESWVIYVRSAALK
jgi:glycerol kinase